MASPQPLIKNDFLSIPPGKEQRFRYTQSQYRDKFWFFLFSAHLVGMTAIGCIYGDGLIQVIKEDQRTENSWNTQEFVVVLAAALVGGVFGGIWLQLMKTCKIMTLLQIYFALMVAFTISLFFLSAWSGIFGVLMLAFGVFWFCAIKSRIPFAETMLQCSTKSLLDHSGAVYVSYGLIPVQFVWVCGWFFVALSIFYNLNPPNEPVENNSKMNVIYFFLLISLYWTCQVIKNVGHVTTAGSVASWWFMPQQPSPTVSALKRALTTSFGSICLGSLIVAIIQAIRAVLRSAQNSARRSNNAGALCVAACAECCLSFVESLVQYFNKYAYTHVAVYGEDFITAAKSTMQLFKSHLFTVIINDDLTGMVLSLGCFLGGAASALISGLLSLAILPDWWIPMTIIGFLIGVVMTSLVTNAMESAIATTYVCWCEDPDAMQAGRPSDFQRIKDSAKQNDHWGLP